MLRRYLADRDVLLLLDNCEHVRDACATLVTTLLGACSNLRMLATSREPLGEHPPVGRTPALRW